MHVGLICAIKFYLLTYLLTGSNRALRFCSRASRSFTFLVFVHVFMSFNRARTAELMEIVFRVWTHVAQGIAYLLQDRIPQGTGTLAACLYLMSIDIFHNLLTSGSSDAASGFRCCSNLFYFLSPSFLTSMVSPLFH